MNKPVWSTPMRRYAGPVHLIICAAVTAIPGCVQAQTPDATPLDGQTAATLVQSVARRVSHTPQLQETPSVLLPGSYYDTTRTPLTAGARAPDFTLPLATDCRWKPSRWTPSKSKHGTISGEIREIKLSSFLAGQHGAAVRDVKHSSHNPVVLVFWAFWCDTWKDVTRDFKKLRPQLADLGAGVLCVAVDASQQPVARRAFASNEIWFPVLIDKHGGGGQSNGEDEGSVITATQVGDFSAKDQDLSIGATFGVRRVPTFFVLDASGRIRTRFEGFPGGRKLLQTVRDARQTIDIKSSPSDKSTTVMSASSKNGTASP